MPSSVWGAGPSSTSPARLLIAIGLVALIVRATGLDRGIWLDEAATLGWATARDWPSWKAAWIRDASAPLYPLLLTVWASAWDVVPWLRMPSVLAGTVTVVISAAWALTCSRRAALWAGLLLTTSPFLLRYSVELRPYPLVAALAAWSFAEAWWLATSPQPAGWHRWSLAAALFAAGSTHYTTILLVPSVVVLMLFGSPRGAWGRVPWTLLASVTAACAALVVLHGTALNLVRTNWWMPPLTPHLLWGSMAEVLGLTAPGVSATGVRGGIAALGVAAIVSVFSSAAPARSWIAPLAAAGTYVAGLAALTLAWHPVWWPRTLLPALILLLVALAIALTHVRHPRLMAVFAGLLTATGIVSTVHWVTHDARTAIEPWHEVATALAGRTGPVSVLPDYAAWPLTQVMPDEQRSRVHPLRLTPRSDGAPSVPDPAPGGQSLVVRVDHTLASRLDAVDEAVAPAVRSRSGLDAVLVVSPDVSLDPSVDEVRAAVERRLIAALGPPERRERRGAIVTLRFGDRSSR